MNVDNLRVPEQIVQFDLVHVPTEDEMKDKYYGRRKLPNDPCKNAKEALVWDA